MEHVLVENGSAHLAPPAGAPCAVLVIGVGLDGPIRWKGRAFVERWRSEPVRVYRPAP
jgi:hypothetical protein